jgi:hypothetical protein
MEQPTIIVSPLKAAIPAQGGHLDLLVRVQAPDLPTDKVVEHTPKRLKRCAVSCTSPHT